MYRILYSKRAVKDIKKLQSSHLDIKAKELVKIIQKNPFQTPPPYEKLFGNLQGYYSRRINMQHRLLYEVREEDKTIRIHKMWTHYE